ncbi:ras guanine nucleotide exchange factor Q-like protein [Parasponia andersonii]|uniref:Ras guanine nucleotide exchange factor Q-like protein n=1 Tax=Parasponia andersonii TaxID=3476 RepID=A0A2P5DHH3_PARAD|nr:ras guanine nucleotide exchange factor Q-like protein [Parasponia andersonii]
MGTKIEFAINPLGSSANSKRFTGLGVDDWDYFQNSGVKVNYSKTGLEDKIQNSMDKNNVDSVKKTMQMHEDIFKHQVRELHRLYSVQKKLMDELKKEIKQSKLWDPMSRPGIEHSQIINWQQSASKLTPGASFHIQSLRDDLNSRECSGSCSADTMRISRGFDLERPAEEDISTGVSAIDEDQGGRSSSIVPKSRKMNIDCPDEDSEVELTLSIGSSLSKKRSNPKSQKDIKELDSSASFKSDRGEDCSGPTTPMSSSSATFDQDKKQPRWLFNGLKLK